MTRQAVQALDDLAPSTWVIAVGKAAHGMASGAAEALRARRVSVAGWIGRRPPTQPGYHARAPVRPGKPSDARGRITAGRRASP